MLSADSQVLLTLTLALMCNVFVTFAAAAAAPGKLLLEWPG